MILHFIILSRQQRTAFALSSSPSLFSVSRPNSQMDPCFSDWLLAALSVSTPCSVPRCWLWCRGKLLCSWLREPSGIWTWCRYSSETAALSPFFLLQTRSRWPHTSDCSTRFRVWLTLLPHSYSAVDSVFLCLSSHQNCLCLCLSVWLQGQHSGSALQLSYLNECSEMSSELNVFSVAAQSSSALWINWCHMCAQTFTHAHSDLLPHITWFNHLF